MSENILNLELKQGADYLAQIELQNDDETPIDLTGCTFAGQARTSYDSTEIAFSFTFTVTSALAGKVDVSLPNTFYKKKMSEQARFVYDWELTDAGGKKKEIARGVAIVQPEVTK